MSLTLTRPDTTLSVPVVFDIRHVPATPSQYLYELRWLCGCVTTECGNGPDRAQAHRDADQRRAETHSCYTCGYMPRTEWEAWQAQQDAVTDRCADCRAAVTAAQYLCAACECGEDASNA